MQGKYKIYNNIKMCYTIEKKRVISMKKYIRTLTLVILSAFVFTTSSTYFEKVSAEPVSQNKAQTSVNETQIINIEPLNLIKNPKIYLNKTVLMKAKFDKFSTLGLDYKPAFKSSDDFISFLIKRDDTTHDIPLSEMKLFLKRDMAEKFIDLKTDDEIEIKGKVFSDALGDTWIDVSELKILNKAPEDKANGVK